MNKFYDGRIIREAVRRNIDGDLVITIDILQDGSHKHLITLSDENVVASSKNIENKQFSGALTNDLYIKKVIYNNPCTIILWSDGSKTSSKCDERDNYNSELGFTLAFLKKMYGSDNTVKLLKEWVPENMSLLFPQTVSLTDIRRKQRHGN